MTILVMRIRVALTVLILFFAGVPTALAEPLPGPPSREAQLNDVKDKLKTDKDQAWFYSGYFNDGVRAGAVANTWANYYKGYTLNSKLDHEHIPPPQTDPGWREYSGYFAEGARGKARVVLGDKYDPKGVWMTVELVELKKNHDIGSVWKVYRSTGKDDCLIWPQVELPVEKCYM
ncbi:hypothetical protein [Actinosynnema sp. NPDC023587]|uniref:hypothetical protein n=1 Tax=Actinosynnema sp. NPDC023587 TaxID=3154695 RepID=UPI003403BD4F